MKQLLLLAGLLAFSSNVFSQKTDSIAVERAIDSLLDAGNQYRQKQRFPEAIQVAQTAAALIRENYGEMHPDYTACLHAEGISYAMMGELEKALMIMLQAREIRERTYGKENEYYLNHLSSLSLINRDLGNIEAAENYSRESLVLDEKMSGRVSARYCTDLNNLSYILRRQRRFSESDSCFQELIRLRIELSGPDHPEVARDGLGRAFMLRDWGRFEAAEQQLTTVLAICAKHPEQTRRFFPQAANCIGMIYAETYRFDLAEQYYLKARDGYAANFGRSSLNYAVALDNLGNLYSSLGLYDQDAALKEEALAIMRTTATPGDPNFIRMLAKTANTYSNLNWLDDSESLLREAEQMHEQAAQQDVQNACHIPYVQGSLYLKKKAYRQAEMYQSKATELIRSNFGNTHPYFFTSTHQQAEILLALREYKKAGDLLEQTKAGLLGSIGKNNIDYANYLNAYSDLLFATGRTDSLPVVLEEYSSLLKLLIRQGAQHLSEHELAGMYSHFQNYARKIFSYTWQPGNARNSILPGICFNQVLFDKGFLLNASIQLRNLAVGDTATERLYQQLLNAKRYLSAQYVRPTDERLGVPELENDIAELEKDLARQVPGFKNAIREVAWQEVQEQLPPHSAAIEWVHFRYQTDRQTDSILYAALLLRPGWDAPRFIPLVEEKQLDTLLQTRGERRADYVNQLYTLAERGAKPLGQHPKTLYETLWKPIEKELASASEEQPTLTIYYAPSGLLHRINLSAIPVSIDSVLGDRYNLVELGSTRQLVVSSQVEPSSDKAVLFGGIRYDADSTAILGAIAEFDSASVASRGALHFSNIDSTLRTGIWNELPFTEREITRVDKILDAAGFQTETHRNYAATEEVFRTMGRPGKASPRILHIATHGFFFPDPKTSAKFETSPTLAEPVFKLSDHPMIRSGLILAGANHAWATGKPIRPGMEDGILTAYEISQMNLSNTELVVLSACETGLGDIQGNEGVYGLQRAFKIAGAKYLIMSLWQVPDKQTSLLMTTFYKKWLEEKMEIPEAFRAAQKELREAGLDPYQWAGFVLVE